MTPHLPYSKFLGFFLVLLTLLATANVRAETAHDIRFKLDQNCTLRYQIGEVATMKHLEFTPPWDCELLQDPISKHIRSVPFTNGTIYLIVNRVRKDDACHLQYRPLVVFKNHRLNIGDDPMEHGTCGTPFKEEHFTQSAASLIKP